VFAGFNAPDLKAIEPHLNRASYPAGAIVFRENEAGNEVLIVTKGAASAYLQLPNTNIRLATFAPGTIFGELAILDEGVRSATVIADKDLVCRTLTASSFAALSTTSPGVAIRLLAAIARELSGRLRVANRTFISSTRERRSGQPRSSMAASLSASVRSSTVLALKNGSSGSARHATMANRVRAVHSLTLRTRSTTSARRSVSRNATLQSPITG
jgi:CRP-like cAMP-binding protein